MQRAPLAVVAALAATLIAGCDDGATSITPSTSLSSAPAAEAAAAAVDYSAWQAGTSKPAADGLYPQHGTAALDVLHYDLKLAWQPAKKTLTGTATLRIRPTADAAQMRLDFKPYEIDKATVDGAPVTATVAKEKLVVPAAVTKDKPVTLVVAYHGKPTTTPIPSHRSDVEPLGLTITKEGGLWTMQEPWGAFTWYPANDHPSDKALYDVAVTVPTGWSGIAAGALVTQQGNTFRYRSTDPMASYLQTLAVGKYKKVSAKGPRGIPLTYWYRPGKDEKFVPSLKKSPAFISFLEKRFGPYPFPTGGAVMVDSESAMETQQMITMGGKTKKFDRAYFEEDVLHEYAHQWFGDSVTPTTWTDLWLNEGWATYAQFLYSQSVEKYSDKELEDYLRRADADLRKRLGPPGKPKAANFAESNVYLCPAAMLKELNDALGDEKFFALARAWVQEHKNTQQSRASFTAFVNEHTGRDFTKLINSWLDSKSTPRPA
ncbi:M1 family metallopeptidase [Actinoplanes sp. Pm04-4]|uniref:Aminopeptidase N n=1 Tax=Paractinoplanes pyxinae TaxID=2997416 RepID=A0ABT4B1N4_9ACTN|nr:M1 family metallopeptidase [Actinoplanes pyxinae]MCY1140417.1 M1 family metallopeptidase [Actinoplanes pyxinae]